MPGLRLFQVFLIEINQPLPGTETNGQDRTKSTLSLWIREKIQTLLPFHGTV